MHKPHSANRPSSHQAISKWVDSSHKKRFRSDLKEIFPSRVRGGGCREVSVWWNKFRNITVIEFINPVPGRSGRRAASMEKETCNLDHVQLIAIKSQTRETKKRMGFCFMGPDSKRLESCCLTSKKPNRFREFFNYGVSMFCRSVGMLLQQFFFVLTSNDATRR